MPVTRYSDGTTTITLGGAIEDYARRMARALHDGAVAALEDKAEAVAEKAQEDWYGANGVTRRTGKSGRIGVVTTLSQTTIKVAIGSFDLAKAKYVHRPFALSTIKRAATHADFSSGKAKASPRGERVQGAGVVEEPNPKASDGKYLLQEFIGKPARKLVKELNAALPTEIEAQMRRGRSG